MAPSWLACCVVREAGCYERTSGCGAVVPAMAVLPKVGDEGGADKRSAEDEDLFLDCVESEAELAALLGMQLPPPQEEPRARRKASGAWRRPQLDGLFSNDDGRPGGCCNDLATRECTDLIAAQAVLNTAREEWCQRMLKLRREAEAELEWANLPTARRMLKANIGDAQKAVQMFLQALEMRAQYAQLFRTMHCEERCDMRIFGRDIEGHPIVYMCARNQTESVRLVRDQFLITFEAACKLAGDMGTVAFVVDMHGLQPHLNMDLKALKDLSDLLGTVFAERIRRITVVDFSRAAQAIWWMLKPLLRPATKEKFAFVSRAQAEKMMEQQYDADLLESMRDTLAINRDPHSTDEERMQQARRTTYSMSPSTSPSSSA
mmetsp:Transcript_30810/g.89538  ORF Transcript_30810/g.89538 Transcript_30810/m.89538 type:complete len:376 (+) Transcript_30810:109-1236(+)